MRAALRVAGVLLYAVLVAVLVAAMVFLHLETSMGRRAVRDVANSVLAGAFRGRLHIGRVTELHVYGRLVARDITLTDAQGRLIADEGVLTAEPVIAVLGALIHPGRSPMPRATLHVRTLRFYADPEGLPSIASTFAPHTTVPSVPGAPGPPAPVFRFPSLEIVVDRFENHIGIDALATDVAARGRLVTEPLSIDAALTPDPARAARLTTARTPPMRLRGSFDWQANFAVVHRGLPPEDIGRMHAVADLDGDAVHCHVELLRDRGDTRLTVDGCAASAAPIDRAARAAIGLDVAIDHAELVHTGPPTAPWTLEARAAVQGQRLAVRAHVDAEGDGAADITLEHTDLARIRAGLPTTDLSGTLHVDRRGPSVHVDTAAMDNWIEHTRVPPVRLTARLQGPTIALDQLHVQDVGIEARGEIDVADPSEHAWAEVRLHDTELGRIPMVHGRARGVVTGEARIEVARGRLTGRFDLHARDVHAPGVVAASAAAQGSLGFEHQHPWLDADVRAHGVVAAGNGPMDVHAHVAGDPQHALEGRLHADASRAVAQGRFPGSPMPASPGTATVFDGAFRIGVEPDRLRINVPEATVALRGARGTLRGNVDVPLRPGHALAGRARIETEGGGAADVSIRGTDVTGRFQGFPLAWVSRALALANPLRGTLEGDLGILTNRAGSPHGTLRWTDGHLPYLGDFDLDVRANHERAVSELDATLVFGADRHTTPVDRQHRVTATVHVIPPGNLANVAGWLEGLRDVAVQAHAVPVATLQEALPRVARVEGTVDATLTAHRDHGDEPLETTLAFDARNVALGWSLGAALPDALQSLLGHNDPRRATHGDDTRRVTVPLRARGAVCTRIAGRSFTDSPLTLDALVSREAGEPVVALPTSCTDPTIAVAQQPLVHASGSMLGRWFDGATHMMAEYGAGLAAGHGLDTIVLARTTLAMLATARPDFTVDVTADSSQWPFVAENIRPLVPALARSPIPGRLRATLNIRGSLAAPAVQGQLELHTNGIEALVGHDEAAITAHIAMTPRGTPAGPFGEAEFSATADGRLIAHAGASSRDAGTAHADVLFSGVLARLLDPAQGFRQADFRRVELTTSQLHIGQLRWARSNNMQGLLTLRATATGDPITPVRAGAEITHFSARTDQALTARVDGFLRNNDGTWELQACGSAIAQGNRDVAPPPCDPDAAELPPAPEGGLQTALILPFEGPLSALKPDPTGIHIDLATNHLRVEPFSPFVEVSPIVRIGGSLTTQLSWTATSPRVITGNLSLTDGTLDLETIGAPAHDIVLDATLRARHADITRIGFGLGNGVVSGHGTAQVTAEGNRIVDLALQAHADRLPALREGNNYGQITGDVTGELSFRTDGLRGDVHVVRAQVLVPEQSSRDLQALDTNPDIFVMGETRLSDRQSVHPYPIDLDFTTQNPVIAARNDLYVGASANGHIHFDPAGLALSGDVTQALPNSWFNIFGKRFDFDRISIVFDGSTIFDPILDIAAHYDSPSAGRINLLVSDRESSPDITFASEQFPDLGQSEVLALLILGRRDTRGAADQSTISQQAQDAAASLLTGLLAGIGTNALRQQFDFLPQIIAEPGANGSGRYGAEVTTLDGRLYIEGAYVSGSAYSGTLSSSAQTSNTSQEFRLLTEYTLSRHWSVSGQAGTSQRYGADLFWSP